MADATPNKHLPAPRQPVPPPPHAVEHSLKRAASYAASALAPATRRAYELDWRAFADWCAAHALQALPAAPATVAAFLAAEADREFRPVTIARRAAAIAAAHRAQDHPNPCDSGAVQAVMSGIRRKLGTEPRRQAAPLELDPLARVVDVIEPTTLAGYRDRALLLLGFAAALRRSELVALDVEDISFDPARGLKLTIRGSKTDQERVGATVAVPYARANQFVRGPGAPGLAAGRRDRPRPVFRRVRRGNTLTDDRLSDQSVALIVKRRAQAAGITPDQVSGHSLRAGYATAAAAAGIEERKIANVTRHKNLPVLRSYIRVATAFDDVGEAL